MAVRTAQATYVFKHTWAASTGASGNVTTNLVASIPPDTTDHIDIAFNPYNVNQVGIIDRCGSWQIMDPGSVQSRNNTARRLLQLTSGQLSQDITSGGEWGRIAWAGDINSFMACDRQRVEIFDIRVSIHTDATGMLTNEPRHNLQR